MKVLVAGGLLLVSLAILVVGGGWLILISMPGERISGEPEPLAAGTQFPPGLEPFNRIRPTSGRTRTSLPRVGPGA